METAALAADAAWGARLQAGAAALGIPLDEAQVARLGRFLALLVADAERSGLTSITDPDAAARLHFLDSLAGLRSGAFSEGAAVADVGAGGGLPGIPLAIVRPDLRLTLIESHHRRADFLRKAVADLGIAGAAVVTARAEAAGRDPALREQFEVVASRAVAAPAVALEYMAPMARVGGKVLAYWGPRVSLSPDPSPTSGEGRQSTDVDAVTPLPNGRGAGGEGEWGEGTTNLSSVAAELGLRLGRVDAFTLPGGDEQRALWIFEKIAPTPSRYPRREGIPAKRPLGGRPKRTAETTTEL